MHQRFALRQSTHHDDTGGQIGTVRYAYDIPSLYWGAAGGTPVDTLTTSEEVTLIDDENLRYAIHISSDTTIADTTLIEGYLVDQQTQSVLITFGEYRIPPGIRDTTIILGLELPGGVDIATVRIHTGIQRGLLQGGQYQLTLQREHRIGDPVTPKVPSPRILSHHRQAQELRVYPTDVSEGATLHIHSPSDGAVCLRIHSMLGREVARVEIPQTTRGMLCPLRLPALEAGVYMVSASGSQGIFTQRIVVR